MDVAIRVLAAHVSSPPGEKSSQSVMARGGRGGSKRKGGEGQKRLTKKQKKDLQEYGELHPADQRLVLYCWYGESRLTNWVSDKGGHLFFPWMECIVLTIVKFNLFNLFICVAIDFYFSTYLL